MPDLGKSYRPLMESRTDQPLAAGYFPLDPEYLADADGVMLHRAV